MPKPVVHFEIAATNGPRLQEFYAGLFGWTVNADNPMNYGMASTKDGDVGIDGAIFEQQDPNEFKGVRIFAQVDDADACLREAVEMGGTVVMPAADIPGAGVRVGIFADPEGNHFGVVQGA